MVPSEQVTVLPTGGLHVPWLGVIVLSVDPAGIVTVTVTPVAGAVPVFVAVTVVSAFPPTVTNGGAVVLLIERFAVLAGVHVFVTVLDSTVVSPSSADAWIVSVPVVALEYEKSAAPSAFVVALPVRPALGPERTANETDTPACATDPRVAVAVTVWLVSTGFVAVAGVSASASGFTTEATVTDAVGPVGATV
jgi:hypothetical protein